jgi:hypothetical protein
VGMAPRSFIGRMKVKVWVKAARGSGFETGSQVVRRIFRMDEMVLRACGVGGCSRMRCSCWVELRFGLGFESCGMLLRGYFEEHSSCPSPES